MKGNVIGFDPDTNTGAISGHDGNRYDFVTADWRAGIRPRHGDVVDFQPQDRRAVEIYLLEAQYVAPSFGAFYFSPSGRISRSQYWLRFFLPVFGIGLAFEIATGISVATGAVAVAGILYVLHTLFGLATLWPSIAILVKRIHDRNKSGWLCLVLYIPMILFLVLLVAWLGVIFVAIAGGKAEEAATALGGLGIIVVVLGVAVMGIAIWFFVEFGCLRGTIGENRFGPDPVRQ